MDKLKIGYSPCPNDTFIFHAITHGLLPNCPPSSTILKDIEGLNLLAFKRKLDLTKISDYEKDILWSIQLRKSYGGMKGDMKMLNYFTQKWYDRFKEGYELLGSNYEIDINTLVNQEKREF